MRYKKYPFSKFTTLIWFLALVFAIYKYIRQLTSLNPSNIRATWQTQPLPQHWPRACCQHLQVVVWKERNISTPSSYGVGLPDYSWCIYEILSINYFTDCLSSPIATSVNVKQVFSQGHIVLSHLCNRLSVQSTHALMCLGAWSLLGYVRDSDIKAIVTLPELPANAKMFLLLDGIW